jgi:hypothetical protein
LTTSSIDAATVTAELQRRVRERLRQHLLDHGGSRALEDAELFAVVEHILQSGTDAANSNALILPEMLGDPATWRLRAALRYESHRGRVFGGFAVFVKKRLLMPVFRWLFEYSRDNFERQRRVNDVLFACVQELAIETARLRLELERRGAGSAPSAGTRRLPEHLSDVP